MEMGWPRWIPSLSYLLVMIGMGVGGVYMGRWMDKSGVQKPVLLGAFMVPIGIYLTNLAQEPILFLVAHGLFMGLLGNAAMWSPLMANATRWFDRRRGVAVAIVASGQFMAFIWPPFFRVLIENVGWRDTYVIFGGMAMVIMVPLTLFLRRDPPEVVNETIAGGSPPDRPLGLSKTTLQSLLGCAGLGCCIAMSIPMVHVVNHVQDLGFSFARAAECMSVLFFCGVISRLAWGWISDRIGGFRTLLSSSLCQFVALSLLMFVESLPGLYAASAIFGLAFGGIIPAYSLVLRDLYPGIEAGQRIGNVYFWTLIGMGTGGFLGGVAFDLTGGYVAAFGLGVAANALNLSIIIPLIVRRFRYAPQTAAA
jgi:MFS family permease